MVVTETPILGSRLPLRRDTVKHALEHHLDNIERGRKQSKMQTLGASNPHNNNKEKHRTAARVTGDTVDKIFPSGSGGGVGGQDNPAYEGGATALPPMTAAVPLSSGNTDDEASSSTHNTSSKSTARQRSSMMSWKERQAHAAAALSDHHSTSTNSKM